MRPRLTGIRAFPSNMRLAAVLLTILAVSYGCGGVEDTGPRPFVYRLASDPPSLDPIHTTDTSSATVVFCLFEGLVDQDPVTLEVVPALAKSWEILDGGLAYVFHLKSGVHFHNGRVMTVEDIRWSFERTLTPANRSERSWVLGPIRGSAAMLAGKATRLEGFETPDDSTVIIRLDRPFAPFLSYLSMECARVAAREGVQGDDFTPIGTGPFRFVEWNHDIRVRIEAFEGYHGAKAGIQRVDFEVVPENGVALMKTIVGELDLVNETPAGQLALIKKKYGAYVRMWPYLRIEYIGFNLSRPPFKGNLKLRQAFAWAVDRTGIAETIHEGAAMPATSILPPGIPGRDSTIAGYGYDIEHAKRLLAEAGYPGGKGLPPITLWYNMNETHQQIAQYIQATLRTIGADVRLKSLDWPAYIKACDNLEPDMYRMGWVADIPDADNFLFTLLHSSQRGAPGNYSGYSNPAFDRLVEEARLVTDQSRRIELYKRADRIATEDVCWIMLVYPMQRLLFNPAYEGLVEPKQGDFRIPLAKLRLRGGQGR